MAYSISKKQYILLFTAIIAIVMTIIMTGCNQKQTEEPKASSTIATTVISPYEKAMDEYKAIIETLPEGSAYAFADMSKDHDVLLVTDAPITFDGNMEAAKATVYGYDKNGHIKNYGIIESTSTSMPIMVKNGYAYYGSHHVIHKATVNEQESKLVVKSAKEGDKNYDAIFNGYANGTIVEFTSDKAAKAKSEKVTQKAAEKATKKASANKESAKKEPAKAAAAGAAAKVTNKDMDYKSADGWRVRYNAKDIASSEIDKHTAQFVYQGKAAGTCMLEIKYVPNKGPEEVLYDVTSKWGDQEKIGRTEGFMPGTKDKWAFWRDFSSGNKGSRLDMSAIAGEYNGGTLLFTFTTHNSGKDAIDMPMSDALSGVVDSITYTNFKDQKMFSYFPGTYKATDKNAKYTSVTLKKDHTGVLTDNKGKKTSITWGATELNGTKVSYQFTIEGNDLMLEVNDGNWVEYSK